MGLNNAAAGALSGTRSDSLLHTLFKHHGCYHATMRRGEWW